MLLLPIYPSDIRFFSPQISMNTNASLSSTLPNSFPIPMEGRDDFFCVDPKSFSIQQLDEYKEEMVRLIALEKINLERINNDSNARINTYNQGISLAEETIKTNSIQPKIISSFPKRPIGCINPKNLTITQLQLYIEGITEEITYEKKLTDEFKKESTFRIEAYQNGIQHANYELNIRKEK